MDRLNEIMKQHEAKKAHENRISDLTSHELLLRCYDKICDFLQLSIDSLQKEDIIEFTINANKASQILQELIINLNYDSDDENFVQLNKDMYSLYRFIMRTIRNGIKERSDKDFDRCIGFIKEIKETFEQI